MRLIARWFINRYQRCKCRDAYGYGKHVVCGKYLYPWMKPSSGKGEEEKL